MSAQRWLGTGAAPSHGSAGSAPHTAAAKSHDAGHHDAHGGEHHDGHHDEHHDYDAPQRPQGHLFGEVPVPGQKRQREDWELIYYWGMGGAFVLAAIGLATKPTTKPSAWARGEILQREEEAQAAGKAKK